MGFSAVVVMVFAAVVAVCIAARDRKPQFMGDEPPVYVNAWAVEVQGGEKVAAVLAAKYGFIVKGKASN